MDYIYKDKSGVRWHVTSYGMTRISARRPGGSGVLAKLRGGYDDDRDQRCLKRDGASGGAGVWIRRPGKKHRVPRPS